ncbi:hypothetical protein EDB83DRAFT_2514134 [Lactarius deliciosus]|nr:hypothetical protein EDB83DRAFT_2514134 [Lactarius deliciosus]
MVPPHDVVRAKAASSSSSLSPLKVLRTYAKLPDSFITALPPTVYFSHTKQTLTISDAYPKALFHFLVLPRLSDDGERSSPSDLTDLRTLLRQRAFAEETLHVLADEAARLRGVIEEEMRARYGFAWEVWAGFHAVPSMEHLHFACHLVRLDRASAQDEEALQLVLAARRVLRAARRGARVMRHLVPEDYEPRLKRVLECFRCGQPAKNMPALKKHLQEEFDALRKREGKSKKRRHEAEDVSVSDRETSGSIAKGKGRKVARLS